MKSNSFYSKKELRKLGLASHGKEVLISRKVSIYNPQYIHIGDNVRIDDFAILSGNVSIGNFVHIAAYTALYGGIAGIIIMDYSNISSKVSIYSSNDDYTGLTMTNPMIPNKYKNVQNEKVLIERHTIIGSGCTVLPGVVLSEGSSFGAMTLINRSSEPWSINVGIPFKKIKNRSKKLLELEAKFNMRGLK